MHSTMPIHPVETLDIRRLVRTIGPADALTVVGDLFWAAERGVPLDLFHAYARLLKLVGRELTDVAPATQVNGRPLMPLSALRTPSDRIATMQCAVGAAIRNVRALDAEQHWRDADSAMKGFAQAEALLIADLARLARTEAALYLSQGRDSDADLSERCAVLRDEVAVTYENLASGIGW